MIDDVQWSDDAIATEEQKVRAIIASRTRPIVAIGIDKSEQTFGITKYGP